MRRILGYVAVCLVFCAGQVQAKDVKGVANDGKGITGKVKAVNATKHTLTITTADGKERTFLIMNETHIVGPRGGVSKERLKDHRLAKGCEITVVPAPDGRIAQEVRLGVHKKTGASEKK